MKMDHNKSKFYKEFKAKVILEEIFKEYYSKIKKDERPDLKDYTNNIGIEVVLAINEHFKCSLESFKNKKMNFKGKIYRFFEKDDIVYSVRKNKCFVACCWNNIGIVKNAFYGKIQDLTEYHKINFFEQYDLYIDAEEGFIDGDNINDLIEYFYKVQNESYYKYRFVYVQLLPRIYQLDLINKKVNVVVLENNFLLSLEWKIQKQMELYNLTKMN